MKARFAADSRAGLFLFLAGYAAALAALLPVLSLWLDEIYDLIVTRMGGIGAILGYVPHVSGNVPLNYIVQYAAVSLVGSPVWGGRLPSALASVAACAGVFVLARDLGLRRPLLAAAAFAAFPLQIRYAIEARPYALALCISVWLSVVFWRMAARGPSPALAAAYSLLAIAGLYTFPFTIFVSAGHAFWAAAARRTRVLLWAAGAIAVAALAFAPWYLHSAPLWRESVRVSHLRDTIGWRAVPMILREIVGAGYIGAGLVLAGAAFGRNRDRAFLAAYAIAPVVLAIAADASFGYMLATRQMIFVLAPLAILFAEGVERLQAAGSRRATSAGFRARRYGAAALAAALFIACVVANLSFFRRPREDWRAAARILASETCVIYSPPDTRQLYAFFVPELAERECPKQGAARVALALSPYESAALQDEARRQLKGFGWTPVPGGRTGNPRIEIYALRRD
jgi:hypothetical protein